ncbi:MAG: phosphoribosylanthranilate isomerase [Chloroflexi bacterium]|nr:phosphoribosylanthranilate isomerase [Chloroflexota bacterium]
MIFVKICGITNIDDARAAVEAGADILGFVFYPPSPRYVTAERASEILSAIRDSRFAIRAAGVFVNESLDTIRAILQTAQLDLAQLHGQEAPELVQALGSRACKSLQARDVETAHALLEKYRAGVNGNAPAFIADAPPAQLPGGNGMIADWSAAREIARAFPILLAGGLTVANVREGIDTVQPWGVDVSSGVERAPGLKDHTKIREFIARAKGANSR